jgi:prepilin-type N-terminal cleavage/methylation domain-containing protein
MFVRLSCKSRPPTAGHLQRRRSAQGFTLIEITLALAVSAVLLSMTLKSQELIEQYRQSQFVTQVQTLITNARSHQRTFGRWPGDCNSDGLIDGVFVSTTLSTSTPGGNLEYAVPTTFSAASATSNGLADVCPPNSTQSFENVNIPYNELKRAGITPASEPNRKSASHGLGGFDYLGTFATSANATIEQKFNAVLLTNVTIQAARRLAAAIDGHDSSVADKGRVRRPDVDALNSFKPLWTQAGESEQTRITVVVFFDRIPH